MDPLSATSLTATIMTVIDFSSKIICMTKQAHDSASGQLIGHSELEQTTKTLHNLARKLRTILATPEKQDAGANPDGDPDSACYELGEGCLRVTTELLYVLDRVKGKAGKRSMWTSLRQAILTIWKQDEINGLERRLDRYRQELSLHLIISLR